MNSIQLTGDIRALPADVLNNTIGLLSAILVFPHLYGDLKVPVFTFSNASDTSFPLEISEEVSFHQIKVMAINTLLQIMGVESGTTVRVLYALIVCAFEEMMVSSRCVISVFMLGER